MWNGNRQRRPSVAAAALIVPMSLQPAIPRRVALQHGPPPLRWPDSFCNDNARSPRTFQRTVTCHLLACLSRGVQCRKWEMGKWKWDSLTRPIANLVVFTRKREGGGPFESSACPPLVERIPSFRRCKARASVVFSVKPSWDGSGCPISRVNGTRFGTETPRFRDFVDTLPGFGWHEAGHSEMFDSPLPSPMQASQTDGVSAPAQCRRGGSKMSVGRGQTATSSGPRLSKILINNHLDGSGRYTVAACLFGGGYWRRHKDTR